MKTFKDIKVGDTVYVYSSGLEPVQRFTVTYIDEFDINDPHRLYSIGYSYLGSKPQLYRDSIQSNCRLNDTKSTFGCYSATVYFNREDVIERFDKDIKALERYKQNFIEKELSKAFTNTEISDVTEESIIYIE